MGKAVMQRAEPCPQCGRELPDDAPSGLCRFCLFETVLGDDRDGQTEDDETHSTFPQQFGDYELLEVVGRGGMGVVYRARQENPSRIVALKMIASGHLGSEESEKRFRAETEAAAALEHPNIVPIYEAGAHEGQPFFTMKFIEGGSLAEAISSKFPIQSPKSSGREPSFSDSAKLIATVARAVDYAHQRGILHRDLKPANILLDAQGDPHVSDFGLAKRLDSSVGLTLSGVAIGTPNYMAPEQAAGKSKEITTAADVYSLGAIFYELLTGQAPFAAATPLATMRAVVEEAPKRPSAINRQVNRDLETICLKCLEKDPQQRYTSARALAEDLERFLRHEPILARPGSPWANALKWAKRKPALAGLLSLALVAPAVIMVVLLISGARLSRERANTRLNLYAADIYIAHGAVEAGNFGLAYQALAKYQDPSQKDLRGFEWYWLWRRAQGESLRIIAAHSNAVTAIAFSPSGKLVASASEDGWVRVTDWVSGRPLGSMRAYELDDDPLDRGHQQFKSAYSVSFSPDGKYVACCSAPVTRVWRVDKLPELYAETNLVGRWGLFLKSGEMGIAFQWPPIAGPTNRAQADQIGFFDTQLRPLRQPWNVTNMTFCLSADGRWLADSRHQDVHVWELDQRALVMTIHPDAQVHRMALSSDGTLLALSYRTQEYVELWNPHSGQPIGKLKGHTFGVGGLAFSPQGRVLASCGADETIRLWDTSTFQQLRELHGHALGAGVVEFSPDGQLLVTGGAEGDVRLWSVRGQPALPPITNVAPPLAFSSDGQWLATGLSPRSPDFKATMAVWNLTNFQPTTFTTKPPGALVFAEPGNTLLAASLASDGARPEVWEHHPSGGTSTLRCRLEGFASPASSLALRNDGQEVVSGHRDGSLRWWDARTGRLLAQHQPYSNWVETVRYSADGRYLMSSTYYPRQLQTWSVGNKQPLSTNNIPGPTQLAFAFAPDGRACVTGGFGSSMHFWHTTSFDPLYELPRQRGAISLFAWSPDDSTLAAASSDGKLRFWHLPTRRLLFTLMDFPSQSRRLTELAFSPDARWFATSDDHGELHLWHGPTLAELATAATSP